MKNIEIKGNWFLALINAYLIRKESVSRQIARVSPKAKLPLFISNSEIELITKISSFIISNLEYKADPLTLDYYTHPETVQAEIKDKNKKYHCDCDDFASYAYLALINSNFKKDFVTCVTIIPSIFPDITAIKWCHVICVIALNAGKPDSNGFYKKAIIDTNGLNFIEYKENENPDKLIMSIFSKLYNTKYELYIDHGYPFN